MQTECSTDRRGFQPLASREVCGVFDGGAITSDAAYILGQEHDIGSLRAGKKADFTILEQDPYDVPVEELKDIPVWGTVFEGRPFPIRP